jgi:glycosyltransferase involved in cell wall biosynthesis
MKYSVVITYCCGRKKELNELLDSIYSQTILPNEVLVVTDGVAPELKGLKFDITLIESNKIGRPGPLRNEGIQKSNYDLIFLSDDDDIWHPQKAEFQINAIINDENVGICFTDKLSFTTDGGIQKIKYYKQAKSDSIKIFNLLIRNNLPLSSCLINRSVTTPVFNPSLNVRGWEDYELWLREVQNTKIIKLRCGLLFYRSHSGSIRNGHVFQMLESQKRMLLTAYNLTIIMRVFVKIIYSLRIIKWKLKANEF